MPRHIVRVGLFLSILGNLLIFTSLIGLPIVRGTADRPSLQQISQSGEHALNTAVTVGWHQEAHDAQHTGFTEVDVPAPWEMAWQWNGSCSDGSDCRPGDPEQGWSFEVPPKSHLVTGDGRLYLPAGEHGVWAINESNGKTAWHNDLIESFCTAAFDPSTNALFVAAADGQLYKLDPSNGTVIDSFQADSGLNLAPTIAAGKVFVVSDDGVLYAVDKHTMALAWSYAAGSPGETPAAYSERYEVVIFGTADLYLHAVNNSDGSRRWRRNPTPDQREMGTDAVYDGPAYYYTHGWPVVAEEHGIVLARMHVPRYIGFSPPEERSHYPVTNDEIRAMLDRNPNRQTMVALRLADGSPAFESALPIGPGGTERPRPPSGVAPGWTIGPMPVVAHLDGDEVVYTVWRNEANLQTHSHFNYEGGICEMVLDDSTVPGYDGGDCRFVRFETQRRTGVTVDEVGNLTLSGSLILYTHWIALTPWRITDRSDELGGTFDAAIRAERQPTVLNRIDGAGGCLQDTTTHFCLDGMDAYCDKSAYPNDGFWVFWDTTDPPYECTGAYSDGYKPRYTIVNDGTIYYELNGGTVFALRSENAAADEQIEPVITGTATGEVLNLTDNRTSYPDSLISRYEKFELAFELSVEYPNPYYYYDPEDTPERDPDRESPYGVDGVSVDAHFVAPSGATLTVPAFWYQDYERWREDEREYLREVGNPVWKVRFAPSEVGVYDYYITVQDKHGRTRYPPTDTLSFQSTFSNSHGFVRVSERDPRFLEYDDGTSFVGISDGLQFWSVAGGRHLKSFFYEDRFDIFGEHGINLVRVWDQNDGYALTLEGEWSEGRPSDPASVPKGTWINLVNAYREDKIIEAAERNTIAIQLCSHGDVLWSWDASVLRDPDWNPDPVGGTDYRHLNYWKRNFRYRVARFGYSTAILAWDTWNEHGHLKPDTSVYDFYQEYSRYQSETDPYHHLRTTGQGSQIWDPEFWSSEMVDIATYHDYMMETRYPDLFGDVADFVHRFSQCLRNEDLDHSQSCGLGIRSGESWQGGPKPWVWAEFGIGGNNWGDGPLPAGNEGESGRRATHNRLWAGLFSPLGVAPIEWYWYHQHHDPDWYAQKHDEAAIARAFFEGFEYIGVTFLATGDVNVPNYVGESVSADQEALRVLAMRALGGQGAYAWVQNRDHTWGNADWTPEPISGSFVLPGLGQGEFQIERWNTTTGEVTVDTEPIAPDADGNLTVPVANLRRDQAVKIIPVTPVSTPTPTPASTPTPFPVSVPPSCIGQVALLISVAMVLVLRRSPRR